MDVKPVNPWTWQDTTNIDTFVQASARLRPRLLAAGRPPAGTLLGVARLFHPDILVEIEATAVA